MAYRALDEKYNNFDGSIYVQKEYDGGLYNLFESVSNIDNIAEIKEIMTKNRAESALMSGSGPSVFGIFKNEQEAKEAAKALNSHGFVAHYCYSVKEIL
jgi:4-diphosphocytidyl-2C-methyl-D-erythritol kinase